MHRINQPRRHFDSVTFHSREYSSPFSRSEPFSLTRATDTVQVLQSCSRGFAATPCSSKSSRLKVHVHVRVGRRGRRVFALSLGLDVHFSQMAVRQIFSKSLSATALHCEKYDNGFFFRKTEAERGRPDVPSHVIRPHFVLERRLVTAVVGLWTMVDTAVEFFWIRYDVVPTLAFVLKE